MILLDIGTTCAVSSENDHIHPEEDDDDENDDEKGENLGVQSSKPA